MKKISLVGLVCLVSVVGMPVHAFDIMESLKGATNAVSSRLSEVGAAARHALPQSGPVCDTPWATVVVERSTRDPAVERAITSSGCFVRAERAPLTLVYDVTTSEVTKTNEGAGRAVQWLGKVTGSDVLLVLPLLLHDEMGTRVTMTLRGATRAMPASLRLKGDTSVVTVIGEAGMSTDGPSTQEAALRAIRQLTGSGRQ